MAHDWGHLIRQGIGDVLGVESGTQAYFPAPTQLMSGNVNLPATLPDQVVQATPIVSGTGCDGMEWTGGTPPKGYKVVNYCGRGVLRKIRRRRRRRLLTASDKADIAAIVGLVGKGQMASSLITRVGA